ncbi:MAG: type II toxin-antitoxin system VapC family toxin [Thermoanaerobaculia bacterium]
MTVAEPWTPELGGSVLVDTNVLLAATTPSRTLHRIARSVLDEWPIRGARLCTCGQVLREYLVVSTRPIEVNGLGLSAELALENVRELGDRMLFLAEDHQVARRLRALVAKHDLHGKSIHDANLAAVAAVHGVDRIVTADASVFGLTLPDLEIFGLPGTTP